MIFQILRKKKFYLFRSSLISDKMFSGTSFHVIQKSSWDINIFPKIYEIALRLSLPGTQGIQEIFMEHFRAS